MISYRLESEDRVNVKENTRPFDFHVAIYENENQCNVFY